VKSSIAKSSSCPFFTSKEKNLSISKHGISTSYGEPTRECHSFEIENGVKKV